MLVEAKYKADPNLTSSVKKEELSCFTINSIVRTFILEAYNV